MLNIVGGNPVFIKPFTNFRGDIAQPLPSLRKPFHCFGNWQQACAYLVKNTAIDAYQLGEIAEGSQDAPAFPVPLNFIGQHHHIGVLDNFFDRTLRNTLRLRMRNHGIEYFVVTRSGRPYPLHSQDAVCDAMSGFKVQLTAPVVPPKIIVIGRDEPVTPSQPQGPRLRLVGAGP